MGTQPTAAAAESTRARLSDLERERLESLTPDRALRFLRGRTLIFEAVAQRLGATRRDQVDATGVTVDARCAQCGQAHGAPTIRGAPLVVSLSHGADTSVVAVADSRRVAAIGVDTEPVSTSFERRAAIASLTGAEPAHALRHWTRVEAVLKADGRGLRVEPVAVRMSGPRHPLATASATIDEGEDAPVYDLYDVAGPEGHLTSVAVRLRP